MAGFSLEITGLDKLQQTLSSEKIANNIAKQLLPGMMGLHKAIESAVFHKYNTPNRKMSQVLLGGRMDAISKSNLFLSTGLTYLYKPVDLSKFSPSWEWGNINPANRKGQVHSITIIRGQTKIVYGKDHRGGFIPRYKSGAAKPLYNGGSQMFERTGNKRLPIRLLLGPSLSQMANTVLNEGNSQIVQAFETLTNNISEHLFDD